MTTILSTGASRFFDAFNGSKAHHGDGAAYAAEQIAGLRRLDADRNQAACCDWKDFEGLRFNRTNRICKSNENVSFAGLHRIGLLAIWKPCAWNRTTLCWSTGGQTTIWRVLATRSKCPPPRHKMSMRSVPEKIGMVLI